MEKTQKKLIFIFSIVITIFTIGIVYRTLQNDTFFNIAIGKHILENGIDMQEHFCWVEDDLYYTHSHWLFDIITYLIHNSLGFNGIYIFTILISILTTVTLFVLLTKRTNSPIVACFLTLVLSFVLKEVFTARSQIISFICFIIEIYCIEKFIETNKKKYVFILIIQAIVVANFHAATWPLELVLFLPYLAGGFLNTFSSKNIYKICAKRLQRKLKKLPADSPKIAIYEKDIQDYERLSNSPKGKYADYKVVRRENYNTRNLIILFLIISLTGLVTPIHGTPYTYIIKSMFGPSNFDNGQISIDYVNEMQPLAPITMLSFITYTTMLITFLSFTPAKIKTEHGFLVIGLMIMALASARYTYLLVFIGSYVLADLMTQAFNILIQDDVQLLEKAFSSLFGATVIILLVSIFSTNQFLDKISDEFVDSKAYPVEAVNYIKNNLDYKNIKIYNSYNNGSYLMLNDIPVFIDSRLDVYCSEFNDTDIFRDFISITYGYNSYHEIFDKYGFTHILLQTNELPFEYLSKDSDYQIVYEDDHYVLFERIEF